MNTLRSLGQCREAVGLILGLMMVAVWPFRGAILLEPGLLLLMIAFLSSAAGFILGGVSSNNGEESSRSVRIGVWGAAIAAVVAASVFALIARSAMNPFLLVKAAMGGVLAILPSMFCGMFAAGVAALTMAPTSLLVVKVDSFDGKLPLPLLWGLRAVIGFVVVMGAGFPVTFEPFVPHVASTPQQRAPAPRPFTYTVPDGIHAANALQWRLMDTRTISGVNGQLLTLSQDDRWLAYVIQGGHSVRVVDLHSSANDRQAILPRVIDRLSLSPSADRLFVTSGGTPAEIAIIDLATGQHIRLPKPKNRAMPSGSLVWWKDKEVLIANGSDRQILNLDTLEIDEASTVATWKETDETLRGKIVRDIYGELQAKPRWRWQTDSQIVSGELPEVSGVKAWPMKQSLALCMAHPERDSRIYFPSISAQSGDRFLSSRDGSKVLRVRADTILISYFDVGLSSALKWTIAMPHSPAECPQAAAIENALKEGTLSGLLYGPMTNPLNQAVVGPDREVVKAVVTFQEWKDNIATVYVSQRFAPVSSGDVLADVHTQKTGKLELLSVQAPHSWWMRLSDPLPGSVDLATLPTLEEKSKQLAAVRDAEEKARKAKEEAARNAKTEEDARLAKQERERIASPPSMPAFVSPLQANTPSLPTVSAQPAPAVPVAITPEERIKAFIADHHKKALRGDVQSLVRDYANKVDYFKHGVVDRNWIFQDELKYHAHTTVLEESVAGKIEVNKLPGGKNYSTKYFLRIRTQDSFTNKLEGGLFDISLFIFDSADGLQITRQRAEKEP